MTKDFSPEERLLRLIRSRAPKQAPASAGAYKPREEPANRHLVSSKVSTALPRKEPPRQTPSFDIKSVFRWENLNLVLIILLIGLLLYFIPLFLKNSKSPVKNLEEKLKNQEKASVEKADEPNRPPFDYFSEQAGARNIFSPVLKEEPQAQTPQEEGLKLEDLKGQLNLLGVVSGDTPQAIIEDKRTQKTYFLNKGSTFDDIEVGDILENKVILIYKGKQFELVL